MQRNIVYDKELNTYRCEFLAPETQWDEFVSRKSLVQRLSESMSQNDKLQLQTCLSPTSIHGW